MPFFYTLFFILMLVAGGCSDGNRGALDRADAIMEENPDSALTILTSLDISHLNSRDIPYYALLMTQAQIKTGIPLSTDSLIDMAYKKYNGDWFGDKGIRSNFYKGEVFFDQGRQRDAMKYYLTAYEEAKRLNNDYWHAKSSERIGDLYLLSFNFEETEKFRKESIEYYGKAKRSVNQNYSLVDLAVVYLELNRNDEALALLDSLYNECSKTYPEDRNLLDYIRRPMIDALVETGNLEEIDSTYYNLLNRNALSIENNILKSRINILKGDTINNEPTLKYINEITSSFDDKCFILYARYQNAKAIGDHALALQLVDSLLFYQNKVAEYIITESVAGAQRDFYSSMANQNHEKSQFLLILLVTTTIFSFIIGLCIWKYQHQKLLARKADLEASIESFVTIKAYSDKLTAETKFMSEKIRENEQNVEVLEKQISEKQKIINELELNVENQISNINQKNIVLETLFRDKWSTLNMLCAEYFEIGDSQKLRNQILKNIEEELRKISSPKGLGQIEDAVNKYMNGIINKLREECFFLNEKDIIFSLLIIAGFSVKAICFLTGIKSGNYYVKKGRIIKRISESEAPNKNLFVKKLTS